MSKSLGAITQLLLFTGVQQTPDPAPDKHDGLTTTGNSGNNDKQASRNSLNVFCYKLHFNASHKMHGMMPL